MNLGFDLEVQREGINPEILKWARVRAGFSLDEVALRFNKSASEISDWEEGRSLPTYNQLEKLAYSIYKRPIALFFFPEPPFEESIKDAYRTLPEFELNNLAPDSRYALREAKARLIVLKELTNNVNPADKLIFNDIRLNPSMSISKAANSIRDYLDITLEQQINCKSKSDAFKMWRNALESNGIYVFKRSFKQIHVSGFCIFDDEFPLIYVNNSTSDSRQIFTLFHELSHIVLGENGISILDDSYIDGLDKPLKSIEIFCNKLAAAILVPRRDFNNKIQEYDEAIDAVEELSSIYNVSREVILRILKDKNMIDIITYKELVEKWNEEYIQSKKPGGGMYYFTQMAYLGINFIRLAFNKYYEGSFPKEKLSEYLNVKGRNIDKLEQKVAEWM